MSSTPDPTPSPSTGTAPTAVVLPTGDTGTPTVPSGDTAALDTSPPGPDARCAWWSPVAAPDPAVCPDGTPPLPDPLDLEEHDSCDEDAVHVRADGTLRLTATLERAVHIVGDTPLSCEILLPARGVHVRLDQGTGLTQACGAQGDARCAWSAVEGVLRFDLEPVGDGLVAGTLAVDGQVAIADAVADVSVAGPVRFGGPGHGPPHAWWTPLDYARDLVDRVPLRDNVWEVPTEVCWAGLPDCGTHVARAKCSGLVTRSIEAATGTDLRTDWGCDTSVPLSWFWYERIVAGDDPRLQRVASLEEALPVDVLVIRYDDTCDFGADGPTCGYENDACDGTGTGHMGFLADLPLLAERGDGWLLYDVPVIDAARTGHGQEMDTRWEAALDDYRPAGGTGRGPMRLGVEAETGLLVGHAWSALDWSDLTPAGRQPLVIGRWTE